MKKNDRQAPLLTDANADTVAVGRFVASTNGPKTLQALIGASAPRFRWSALNPWPGIKRLFDGLLITLLPVAAAAGPAMKRDNFLGVFSEEALRVFELALSQEEQRASRFDQKASAILSLAGILIPLVVAGIATADKDDRLLIKVLLGAVLLAALSGFAAFRALQTHITAKISQHAALDEHGTIRGDIQVRYGLNLLHCLMVETGINDYRARLISAAGRFAFLSTLVICAAGGLIAHSKW